MASRVIFHGNLRDLLSPAYAKTGEVPYDSQRHAAVKDVLEALGVPHTEVERIVANGVDVPFSHLVEDGDHVEVHPPVPPVDLSVPSLLRPAAVQEARFVADVNVGRLAMFLRMAGFDTVYGNSMSDDELAGISSRENRILLTKDTRLLRRKIVVFGHLVRAVHPRLQLAEIVRLYGLESKMAPFSRCMLCNGLLVPVSKGEILHRLEPLTKKYYDTFYICPACDKVYWSGSHKEGMLELLGTCAGEVLEGS